MRYRLLGRSGVRVSELALGTMGFGTDWGWGADEAESRRMFDAYANAGGNFLDTANVYTQGTSERYLGDFIAADRDHWVVATKYTLAHLDPKDPNASGNHRKNMRQAVEASLDRLDTAYIDLLWVHAWDYLTRVDEVMRGLDDLVRSGAVLYVGISDTPAWVVSQANTLADLRGWTPFTALQLRYSLIDRTAERDLLPMAREFDLAVTPWSVLAAGVLTGKYNRDDPPETGRAKQGAATVARNLEIAKVVVEVAGAIGCSPAQAAIAWARQQRGVVIPLVGASNAKQLEDNLGAVDVWLHDDQMAQLDEVSATDPGFPHNMIGPYGSGSAYVYGDYLDRLDVHRGELADSG
jgi:aryl-alcohol dehydrogenase-like predicted oxidoreductase